MAVVLLVGAQPAQAHFSGHDSVDGGEIRYGDDTQWNDALNYAIAAWENLPGGVSIAPDTISTVQDLDVDEYTNTTDGRCGKWVERIPGADDIFLNNHYYQSAAATTTNKRACMTHEWGHAHGLAHSFSTEVMDSCPVCTTVFTTPQSHDKSDYNVLW